MTSSDKHRPEAWRDVLRACAWTAALVLAAPVHAQAAEGGVLGMMQAVAANVPAVENLVKATAFVMGLIFIAVSLGKFSRIGQDRGDSVGGAIAGVTVGAMLCALPAMMDVGSSTLGVGDNQSILAYAGSLSGGASLAQAVKTAFIILVPFGWIAFIRGLVVMKNAVEGQGGNKQGVGTGIVFVVGGILLANAGWSVCMLTATFGAKVC